jgi:hypothetical protein
MDEVFDAAKFLEQLDQGAFDGHLNEEFRQLSREQLEQVAFLPPSC